MGGRFPTASALVARAPEAAQDNDTPSAGLSTRRQIRGCDRRRPRRYTDIGIIGRSTDLIRARPRIEEVERQQRKFVSVATSAAMPVIAVVADTVDMSRHQCSMCAHMWRLERAHMRCLERAHMRLCERGRCNAEGAGRDHRGGKQATHVRLLASYGRSSATATAAPVSAGEAAAEAMGNEAGLTTEAAGHEARARAGVMGDKAALAGKTVGNDGCMVIVHAVTVPVVIVIMAPIMVPIAAHKPERIQVAIVIVAGVAVVAAGVIGSRYG